jgi:catechol 2,3-dioxygenase-like lactoylglutathione lyase family enzyme
MFDHVGLNVRDYAASRSFYEQALAPLGYRVVMAFDKTVDAFHAAALAAGGRDNGEPGPREHYHLGYYGAFVLDADGNNVEAVCHRHEWGL